MLIRLHLEAEADLLSTHLYFQNESGELADLFQAEVARMFGLLVLHPAMGRAEGCVRSVLVRRLPYRIVYQVKRDHVFIVAVAHQSRDRTFWHRRL